MTPEQCRAAREMLGWNQEVLGCRASVAPGTVSSFERDARRTTALVVGKLRRTLEGAGIEFGVGGTVRKKVMGP